MVFRHMAHENIVLEDSIEGLGGVLNDCRAAKQQAQDATLAQVEEARRGATQVVECTNQKPNEELNKLLKEAEEMDERIVKSDVCCVIS